MDDNQFDGLIREFGQGTSRRWALGLLAAAAGLGLREVTAKAKHHKGKGRGKRKGKEKAQGKPSDKCTPNNKCAQWCASTFGANTPEAGQCTSDANKCQGPCARCGPGCKDNCQTLCGQQCVDTTTDANCGTCGNVCTGDDCNTPACQQGRCETTPTPGAPCDGGTGTCDASGQCQPNTPNVCSGKNSPNPCFELDADTCGVTPGGRSCRCGTDIDGNLSCYENAYCNNPVTETPCASNADCVARGFPTGSVCFSAEFCCGSAPGVPATGCTTPCPAPSA